MEKKEPMGFKTPSMRIQEEYKEILEQLMAKKANWEQILKDCSDLLTYATKGADEISESVEPEEAVSHEHLIELEHRMLLYAICMSQVLVAKVGTELAECDIRVSNIEKELKEIRRVQR